MHVKSADFLSISIANFVLRIHVPSFSYILYTEVKAEIRFRIFYKFYIFKQKCIKHERDEMKSNYGTSVCLTNAH